MLGRLCLVELYSLINILNLIWYSLEFVTCLILGHFRSFFEGVHQFWASVAKGVGGWEVGVGVRWEVATGSEKLSREAPQ